MPNEPEGDVVEIRAPDSLDGSEGLLAVVVRQRYGAGRKGTTFFTRPEEPLQLAFMRHPPGSVVPAHRHLKNPRNVERTQEVLLVTEGAYELTVYTSAGQEVSRGVLEAGDLVLLLCGGHRLEAMYVWSALYEVKTGPYHGRDRDKEPLPAPPPRS